MTDEIIKEEFEISGLSQEAVVFSRAYSEVAEGNRAIGFYLGFKTAERLAKIEVLEELRKSIAKDFPEDDDFNNGKSHENTMICLSIGRLISELKAEK
jgi:predicted nucleic acid-binding protein